MHARRSAGSVSADLDLELLKQPAQFERRRLAVVRHDWHRRKCCAVYPPAQNRRRFAALSTLTPFSALAPRAGLTWLSCAGDELPGLARTQARTVGLGDKARSIERHHIER